MKKIALFFMVAFLCSVMPAFASSHGAITTDELNAMLGSDVVVLDVRSGRDWSSSEFKIKGAVRANPSEFSNWAMKYPPDTKLVLY